MAPAAHHPPESVAAALRRETVAVYLPVVRWFLLVVAAYYAVVTVNHLTSESGMVLLAMVGLSVLSSGIAFSFYHSLKRARRMSALEVGGLVGNALLLLNLLFFYVTQYDSNRLVYFVMMVFIFAMTSASARVAILSSIATLAALYATLWIYEPALLQQYIYIGVASSFGALGLSRLVRRIILEALDAKLLAAEKESEAVEAAAFATQLAITDNLTSLPNRRDFFDKLNARAKEGAGGGRSLAVFLIDLDGFKPINDTYGHGIGDKLLVTAGRHLVTLLPEDAYLARIGGDEFAALLWVKSEDEALSLGEALCQGMRAPFNLGQVAVHVGATVGIAIKRRDAVVPEELLEQADFALFSAKRRMKGRCTIFSRSDAKLMKWHVEVEQALRRCDMDEELSVVYQPQVDIMTNEITGFEALARWDSRELGAVGPATFIGVAESSGLISKVTQVLLRKTLEEAKNWPTNWALSFNLSVHDLLDATAVRDILETTRRSAVEPSRICFEITETVVMSDIEAASASLQELVDAGHKIALDDFGTGHSSFSYLHQLPIDKIKVDRSFLKGLGTQTYSTRVLAALLQLIRSLQKDCIVEGVESEVELAAVRGLGARVVQGYYFGQPKSAAEVHELRQQHGEPKAISA